MAFIALFGFILMTPQLYLNYKLKSVDHMNWRGMIYRFITTIIDDLFAFMVTMPALRRVMYFRDGILWVYLRFDIFGVLLSEIHIQSGLLEKDPFYSTLIRGASAVEARLIIFDKGLIKYCIGMIYANHYHQTVLSRCSKAPLLHSFQV